MTQTQVEAMPLNSHLQEGEAVVTRKALGHWTVQQIGEDGMAGGCRIAHSPKRVLFYVKEIRRWER